ncbi:MAG TPA: NAD(P)-dependent oxidoreductase [Syntrophorhabdaceae bacterium]|nr:NAD(P)-dependent oxidoreductase [Syntrophorhabdaceae bacterium]HOT41223.1 NAD(P)-dependent oxidoreductase [Syntrophorhabdaceae bacterium]HPC65714.1 NAD(P)-dependent oxidoreductase [Syntrophorhabdaceae bacterium]HQE79916.1 NAD(P)-dependent oxidoreductase [Syntrophorhabdaceae bacterium]HQH42523.1 NAD(P)-dependent oxidoreductase [Syntrophorhabdaceae bacterium]
MKIGFIGLGYLGKTMAKRMISEGVDLTVWNRTQNKAMDLGVEVAESPMALADKGDIIFLNLFDSLAVRSVLFGELGLLKANLKGKIIVDTTTNHFEDVLDFYKIIKEKGGFYLESPVLGSVIPASQGNLVVLVSGEKYAYEKALPYIEKIGKTIFYLEKETLATKMKLINNLILGTFMAAISEAVAFGEMIGMEKKVVLDILSSGAGNSGVMNAKKEKILKEDFSTHFSSALIYKDLHYLQDLAKGMRRPLFLGSIVKEMFALTFKDNIEGLDFSALYKVLKEGVAKTH